MARVLVPITQRVLHTLHTDSDACAEYLAALLKLAVRHS